MALIITDLDLGESESIALAIEEKAKYLIIDEWQADITKPSLVNSPTVV